jgi:hypothetical protein
VTLPRYKKPDYKLAYVTLGEGSEFEWPALWEDPTAEEDGDGAEAAKGE